MYDHPPEDPALLARRLPPPVWFLPHPDGGYGVYQDDRGIVLRFEEGLFAHLVLVDGIVVHVAVGSRAELTPGLPADVTLG